MIQPLSMATTPRDPGGCRKSVIRISLDFESALVTSAGDSLIAGELRVFPFHRVAFQPPVRDDADDHGLEACLLHMDERAEGVFQAVEVVKSHDLSDTGDDVGLLFENLPGKNAIADIPSDYPCHVRD